jgi:hypothetical protein
LNIGIVYHFAETDFQKAWLIRGIGDRAASIFNENTPGMAYRSKHAWEARDWLSVEETVAEQFLTQFSVLNCFQAQIMLSQTPSLRSLLAMPLNDLVDRFSLWVPERNLLLWFDLKESDLFM